MMSELALKLIAENKITKSPFLDLGNCGLVNYLPNELLDCVWLEGLNLGGYYVDETTNEWVGTAKAPKCNLFKGNELIDLQNLKKLKSLYLRFNQISDVKFLKYLPQIESLDLSNNNFKDTLYLSILKNLKRLSIGNNQKIQDYKFLKFAINIEYLDLCNNGFEEIDFLKNLTKLKSLDLSNNIIKSIFSIKSLKKLEYLKLRNSPVNDFQILENFNSLRILDLSNNNESELLFAFLSKLKSLQNLDLSNNNIFDFKFLSGLSNLKILNLSYNKITQIPFLNSFDAIEELNLGHNEIGNILYLNNLRKIHTLNLNKNQIVDISPLENLKTLHSLSLSSNRIGDFSILSNFTNLHYLNLHDNNIYNINFLKNLKNLNDLEIGLNNITNIDSLTDLINISNLGIGFNSINNYHPLENLVNLSYLNIGHNRFNDFNFLKKLKKLRHLYIGGSEIKDIDFLEDMTNLTTINLSENQIVDISSLIPILKNGVELDIKHSYSTVGEDNIIGLYKNPITNPPIEIIEQGTQAVLEYFEKLEIEGKDYIYESKLTLVGDGGAGKTSLQERIIDKKAPLPKSEERTRGIKISNWNFKDKKNKNYTVNIWDFGGQDVYYPVHRFFLTENSVYVLMASTRIQSHNFEYWIPTIYQFGGNSPIILVQTCHDNNRSHWNDLGIFYGKNNFNIPYKHFELNLPIQNEGLSILENAIEQQIIQLPHIGKPVPKSWVKVREALAERQKVDACISYEKFTEICQLVDSRNFKKNSDIELLGRFFADLGIILWYHDKDYLKDWVILQPQWAMLAVYKIIDDIEVQKCGIIRKNDFKRLWSEEVFLQKQELLKNMIQVFKIAFPKKHSKEDFILPARLNSLPEEKRWTNIDKTIRLEYTFDFMPRGIVNQLSAELSRQIKSDSDVWNNAVNFDLNGSEAQVEEDYFKRNLYIKANGQDARGLVVLIMESIENILEDYKGVKPTKNVPCSCQVCQKSETPTLFSYPKLIEWSNTKKDVRCNESSLDLSISSLLYSVGLNALFPRNTKDLVIEDMSYRRDMVERITNQNTVSPVFNISTNPQTSTAPETPKVEFDTEKELKIMKKNEEDSAVRIWRNKALITFIISLLLTIGGLYVYVNELGNFDWKTLKGGEVFKWVGIGVMAILNGFPIKMMYDRFLDDSKEKAFRENLKNKQ